MFRTQRLLAMTKESEKIPSSISSEPKKNCNFSSFFMIQSKIYQSLDGGSAEKNPKPCVTHQIKSIFVVVSISYHIMKLLLLLMSEM
jgi:hypothetical protein